MLIEALFVISAVIVIVSLLGAMLAKRDLKKRLLESHPGISEKLSLSLSFESDETSRQRALSEFLRKKSFESLNDENLSMLCDKYMRIGLIFKFSSLSCLLLATVLLISSQNLIS